MSARGLRVGGKRLRCHLWLHQDGYWTYPNVYGDDIEEEFACLWCGRDSLTSWRHRFWSWLWGTRAGQSFIEWEYRRAERRGDFRE